ncbi:unnamed protein product [Pseudo-nitzschia multistriata]|uniref:Uncharacterized protein n=1 Tax=Pseudo-nitzschia multistriata TaxID=183589 RepID=A0A448ZGG8_9STRA|nr:unnamed protein product [Pseudo-nitzschia multistriata]
MTNYNSKYACLHASCLLLLLIASSTVTFAESFLQCKNSISSVDHPTPVRHRAGMHIGSAISTRVQSSTDKAVSIPPGGGDKSVSSPEEERTKANEIMTYCAKITALSAVVDLLVDGSSLIAGIASGDWIFPLTTLWKVSFSYNVWRVSKLYKKKTKTVSDLYQLLEKFLVRMTGIWRRLAVMVSLLSLESVVTVWKDSIPNIRPALNALYAFVGIVSIKLSANETENLAIKRPEGQDDEASPQRIVRLGRVAVRAMSLGVSAFVLDSIMTPAIALRKPRGEAIVLLLDLTVSIPFAIVLWKLRRSYIGFIEDVANTPIGGSSSPTMKARVVKPETQIQLAIAQQNFWGRIKSFQQHQMFYKTLALIAQYKVIEKVPGVFAK